jgi:mannose-1-phosphate guanylyltransferase
MSRIDWGPLTARVNVLPVILAGGLGSRLWPLSREAKPKQFLAFDSNFSMLQRTLERVQCFATLPACVVCGHEHRFLVAEQLCLSPPVEILLEPCGRSTAAALALAALKALRDGGDPVLLVLPADHVVADQGGFERAIAQAVPLAEAGHLVLLGVVPDRAETGFGYIRRSQIFSDGAWSVDSFVEKPALAEAQNFLSSGEYFWNSGMFVFRASRFVEELARWRPDILAACQSALVGLRRDLDFWRVDEAAFALCPSESIDRAVMEKTDAALVVALDVGWSDVGTFGALWEVLPHDGEGNALRGDVFAMDSHDNLIFSESALVATVGLRDCVVVQTKDVVFVAPKARAAEAGRVVAVLREKGRSELEVHREVFRPWGHYESMDRGARFQVKRITVKPGGRLSVQMHHHRAEHWIVVSGTAKVSVDGVDRLLSENESVYLPLGCVHALENPGKIALELIEVQVGSYLGEDDIVRLQDRYGRVS